MYLPDPRRYHGGRLAPELGFGDFLDVYHRFLREVVMPDLATDCVAYGGIPRPGRYAEWCRRAGCGFLHGIYGVLS